MYRQQKLTHKELNKYEPKGIYVDYEIEYGENQKEVFKEYYFLIFKFIYFFFYYNNFFF